MGGRGTVCNLASGDPEPYGGITKDWEFNHQRQVPFYVAMLCTAPLTLEVGATLVGDTLTLPITWTIEARDHPNRAAERQAEREAELIGGPAQYTTNIPEDEH
jgi:hypothetical protein